jgi:hypothetical protein
MITPNTIKDISAFFSKETDCLKSIFLIHRYINIKLTKQPMIILKTCFFITASNNSLCFMVCYKNSQYKFLLFTKKSYFTKFYIKL